MSEPSDADALIAALDHEDGQVRGDAARELGKLREPRAVRRLIALLNDKELGVQSAAAWALGEIGDSQAVTPLLEKARAAEADPFVRRLSRQSLQQLGYRAPGDADGLNPVFLWAPGLALLAAGVGLGAVLGPFAVPIFLAGLVLLVLYFLRERGAGPSGDLAVDDDGSLSPFDGGGGGNGAPG